MNKRELVEAVTQITSQDISNTENTINAFVKVVTENIASKEGVKIVGFGTFAASLRKERTGRNPRTGEKIQILARTVPVFRPGKDLRNFVL